MEIAAAARSLMATGHAEALVPMIDQVVSEARAGLLGTKFGLTHLDRIVVTHGPGTFTGVRTGIAAARGLALALDKPVVSISSLAVIAATAREEMTDGLRAATLVVAMQAGRGWLYVDTFAAGDRQGAGPRAIAEAEAGSVLGSPNAVLVGTAAGVIADRAASLGLPVLAGRDDVQPDVKYGLSLTADMNSDHSLPVPLYLRPPDARPQSGSTLQRASHYVERSR